MVIFIKSKFQKISKLKNINRNKISIDNIYIYQMPQKLEQYLKEVEGLINNGLKTDSNTLKSLKDMQKEMTKEMMKEIKEMKKGDNRKKKEKMTSN